MEERVIIKLSRRIEYLVHKRHRSLMHIQKALADSPSSLHAAPTSDVKEVERGGVFWMNSIFLNKKIVQTILSQQFNPQELKQKTDRFYYLGFSLGKVIDLGNAQNLVYSVLQLFEEYDAFTTSKGAGTLETNGILRHILPVSSEPLGSLQLQLDQHQRQLEDYVNNLALSETTPTASGTDNIETVRKQPILVEAGSPRAQQKHDEVKGENVKVRSQLPVPVQFQNKYDDFILKSSTVAASQTSSQQSLSTSNQGLQDQLQRIHPLKVDSRAASFKVLSCHSIPVPLNYCEVVSSLIDMLILTYNKIYDNQYLSTQMIAYIESIDNIIVNKVIKAICEDVNRVARVVAVKQLAKINKALKLDTFPPGRSPPLLQRVPSDDNVFEIAPIDFSNKQDSQLFNANQQFLQMMSASSGLRKSDERQDKRRDGQQQ